MVLRFKYAFEPPAVLVIELSGSCPQVSNEVGLGLGLRLCIIPSSQVLLPLLLWARHFENQ